MRKKRVSLLAGRYYFVLLLLSLCFAGILARLLQLQVLERDFLNQQGDARAIRHLNQHAFRGIIKDRNGEPLAVSTAVNSIWVNSKEVFAVPQNLRPLASILQLDYSEMLSRLKQAANKEFVYLKRQLNPDIAAAIENLHLQGVYSQREYRRYYPVAETAAHVVGFTDIDDKGQEGLELAFDHWLRGKAGSKKVLRDRMGRVIEDIENIQEPQQGNDLVLSLDRRIQFLAYKELLAAVQKHAAKSGSLVILDVDSGEVIAMVNQPSFNPNNRANRDSFRVRNRAVTDIFEPGSVIKAFSMAVALEQGHYPLTTEIDTAPGFIHIDGNRVRDVRNFGVLDLTGIIRKSSNVGISKLLLPLPPNVVAYKLQEFGFGQSTGSGFPGEAVGRVVVPRESDRFSQSTQAFGYGLSVTTLQLAQAYASLGAYGLKRPVSFIKVDEQQRPAGQRVISAQTAKKILAMLSTVITSGGSGTRASIPGYQIAGKTGTSRKVTPLGYSADKHQALFAGLIPASKPKLAMVVMIDEPSQGKYYGGVVAAPIFAKVMAGAARLLNITPDNLSTHAVLFDESVTSR